MTLTSKQEAFARFFVETGNASEAYRRAYQVSAGIKPETVHKRASELLANGEVTGRVSQLQGKAAKRAEITVQSLADELEEARAIGKAKLFGLGSENRRVTGTIPVVQVTAKQLEALSDDELATLETAYPVLQKLGLIGSDSIAAADAGSAEES